MAEEIKIELAVGAETDTAWIIQKDYKDKAVATCPAEALFIVARKMGFMQVELTDCQRLLKIGRRAAILDQKSSVPEPANGEDGDLDV